ncbi:helicase-related protein [Algoriphagus sp. C2-6-M1]|uniref:helicase-related protein n=1 Tax=Algoriphagus persicinus TaxID=3108754 RepID=UPI002B3F858E|nr:helicase-related protein [Algoriphagus sp. C2-6-M1]MEB2782141.1 helicase-related protein [Algoriphagus sp. C2-6-M1]
MSCTSTLELGIDIGSVDEVVQIDSTHSIAFLIQRVGRSGRKDDQHSNLFLYATEPWSLLQSIACWLLYREGFIEPPQVTERPFDILLHQALSITKGHSGLPIPELIDQLGTNPTFKYIKGSEIKEIIDHLIEIDLLEKRRQEVIIGVEGEKLVNSRNFYSMFQSEDTFSSSM